MNITEVFMIKSDTQKQLVLDHMKKYGSITSNDAIYQYSITRLADVIFKLRTKEGIAIISEHKKGLNRFGKEVPFVEYRLATK